MLDCFIKKGKGQFCPNKKNRRRKTFWTGLCWKNWSEMRDGLGMQGGLKLKMRIPNKRIPLNSTVV